MRGAVTFGSIGLVKGCQFYWTGFLAEHEGTLHCTFSPQLLSRLSHPFLRLVSTPLLFTILSYKCDFVLFPSEYMNNILTLQIFYPLNQSPLHLPILGYCIRVFYSQVSSIFVDYIWFLASHLVSCQLLGHSLLRRGFLVDCSELHIPLNLLPFVHQKLN